MHQIEYYFPEPFFVEFDLFSKKDNIIFSKKAAQLNNTDFDRKTWQGNTYSSLGFLKIQDEPAFKNLVDCVCDKVKLFAESYGSYEKYFLKDFWFNISSKGSYQEYHKHPDSVFSAVYYSKVPKGSGYIQFQKPFSSEISLKNADFTNPASFEYIRFTPKEGMLLIFRSYVMHLVSNTTSKTLPRISFSFNFN